MPGTARNCWDGFGRPFVRGVDGLNQFLTLRGRLQALRGIVFVSSVGDGPRPFPGSPLSLLEECTNARGWGGRSTITNASCDGESMRTFLAGTTKIDVVAQISREALELDRLVLSRFQGSAAIAHAAFQSLLDRYRGKPLAEYAVASEVINLA